MKRLFNWLRRPPVRELDPLPEAWAQFLWENSAHYRRLPGRLQFAFALDVQQFIATKRITGVETPVDDHLRLLVAASAATLSVGWPGYRWTELSEVLLYPDDFDRDYVFGRPELAGIADVWGTVILSIPSLRKSFDRYDGSYHLGLHEFAHLLTYDRGQRIEVPVGLPFAQMPLWHAIQAHEMNRLAGGDGESIIDPYGQQPSEFFPCAVEVFFQMPLELRARHQRLYQCLRRYFRQNPAVWEARFRVRYPL